MCGRYVRRSDKQRLAEAFHLGELPVDFVLPPENYNIAPQSTQPVVRVNPDSGQREMRLMRWGLIPSWAKDAAIGKTTTNARAETVATKPAFRGAFKSRHCLVPADLFYEWRNLDPSDPKRKNTQPYAIGLKNGSPMAFAGLWETWTDKTNGLPLESFTIITTDPNALMEPLHDRMPVIVPPSAFDRWLASSPDRPPVDMLRPYDAAEMTAWKVGKAVGNSRVNGAELCQQWE
ncbi:Putative SOS response-associated peptidase YedK [Granulicella rosea]|uniref:Abasic site processing protein n=1 Tax=Granulicella rosea TaxID=474952 RepID=A0A239E7F4_9BACT|nr:SOS response-associated peptidase [Granulicella rosea]SNS40680.1 Putative SOS response-associated peptidase YedK [Granulicella rosea]